MSNYDPDPITREIADYWNEDSEAQWDKYVELFALKPKGERVNALRAADAWLAEQSKPTKEHAAMWSRKRELENLHWRLDHVGK